MISGQYALATATTITTTARIRPVYGLSTACLRPVEAPSKRLNVSSLGADYNTQSNPYFLTILCFALRLESAARSHARSCQFDPLLAVQPVIKLPTSTVLSNRHSCLPRFCIRSLPHHKPCRSSASLQPNPRLTTLGSTETLVLDDARKEAHRPVEARVVEEELRRESMPKEDEAKRSLAQHRAASLHSCTRKERGRTRVVNLLSACQRCADWMSRRRRLTGVSRRKGGCFRLDFK